MREVYEAFRERRPVAYTTVLTMRILVTVRRSKTNQDGEIG